MASRGHRQSLALLRAPAPGSACARPHAVPENPALHAAGAAGCELGGVKDLFSCNQVCVVC